MTTLIVGCGYLGRRVGRWLHGRGEVVLGTTRSPDKAESLCDWGITPIVVDVLDRRALESLPPADRVVYCVGYDRSAGIAQRTVYVEGLRNVLDRCADREGRWVYASSTGVYGQDDGGWVDEASPTQPRGESGRICLEAEQVLMESGVPSVIVRYSGLYGPDRLIRRAALERGEPIAGDPERFLNLIHIDDAAAAAVAALDRGECGTVYLASDDRPVRRREYYERIAEFLGVAAPRFDPHAPGGRDEANKRVANRRLRQELGVVLAYPSIDVGIPAALAGSTPR